MRAYIITTPDRNHATNSTHPAMPIQRCEYASSLRQSKIQSDSSDFILGATHDTQQAGRFQLK